MIRGFQIAAAVFAGIAAYFLWMSNKDAVFVSFVLAASCLFLSIRFQAKARLDRHKAEQTAAEGDEAE
ncbi:hypothetical protein BH10ACI3_BH10ACI3_06110 [soil metagenome]